LMHCCAVWRRTQIRPGENDRVFCSYAPAGKEITAALDLPAAAFCLLYQEILGC
jgi:hypothetical protein